MPEQAALGAADTRGVQPPPPCPFCQSEDTRVVRHNGLHGTLEVCHCNACGQEWSEETSRDTRSEKE